jgi:hypothetical protein
MQIRAKEKAGIWITLAYSRQVPPEKLPETVDRFVTHANWTTQQEFGNAAQFYVSGFNRGET